MQGEKKTQRTTRGVSNTIEMKGGNQQEEPFGEQSWGTRLYFFFGIENLVECATRSICSLVHVPYVCVRTYNLQRYSIIQQILGFYLFIHITHT